MPAPPLAAAIMLGWLSLLPSVAARGLDFQGEERLASIYVVAAPLIAGVGAALAWRSRYPVAGALVVTAPTVLGIAAVLVLAVAIAVYGF